jgi:AcrR family transcriptional regulator
MVAESAGVSIGLVQHYFGSKAGLIATVDQHVLNFIANEMEPAPLPAAPANGFMEAGHRLTSMIANAPRSSSTPGAAWSKERRWDPSSSTVCSVSASPNATTFTDQQLVRPDLDPIWAAINPLILRIGAIILHPHIERHLPEPLTTPAQPQRWDAAVTILIREGQLRRNP